MGGNAVIPVLFLNTVLSALIFSPFLFTTGFGGWAVQKYILLKSNEEYYADPVCKHGYFRGIETYNFVRDIIQRFNRYKEVIKE